MVFLSSSRLAFSHRVNHQCIKCHAQQQGLKLLEHQVTQLTSQQQHWQLEVTHQATTYKTQHDCVILANGHRITDFIQSENCLSVQ